MKLTTKLVTYFAWGVAVTAALGSLYFSEVMKLPPCILCWYQRIAMYPLALIIPVGIVRRSRDLPYFVLPLAVIGAGIAVYHNLLYYQILPESAAPCKLGVSCTTKLIEWLGFITIPLLSLTAFLLIIASMVYLLNHKEKTHDE